MTDEVQAKQRTKANVEEFLNNKIGKAKTYVSRRPGYTLTLPTGLALNNGKNRIVFDSYNGREFKTDELPIQDFLESHKKFGQPGVPNKYGTQTEFFYSPSPEEVKAEQAAREARKQIEFIKKTPGLTLDLSGYNDIQLTHLAIQLGVPVVTVADGEAKARTSAAIRGDIEVLIGEDSLPSKNKNKSDVQPTSGNTPVPQQANRTPGRPASTNK